jgi:four helix bundle protein
VAGTSVAGTQAVAAARQDLCERAFRFAGAVLERYPRLAAGGAAQSHMTQQLFRSVSAIGANLEEGQVANSRRDMALKYAVALREARESRYWLRLLATHSDWSVELTPLLKESSEFIAMLTVSVRRLRGPSSDSPHEGPPA